MRMVSTPFGERMWPLARSFVAPVPCVHQRIGRLRQSVTRPTAKLRYSESSWTELVFPSVSTT